MTKFRIVNFIDKLFILFSTFLIIYAWLNFYIRNLISSLILSICFSFAITFIIFYFAEKHQVKQKLVRQNQAEINKNFLAFKLLQDKQKLNLIRDCLKIDDYKIANNRLIFSNNNQTYTIIVFTEKNILTQDDLINIISSHKITTEFLIIICEQYSSDINCKIIKTLDIKLVNKEGLYLDYFKPNNIFPDCSILNDEIIKPNYKMLVKNLFQSKKSKQYFWLGLVLIFSSLILPFKIYYLIFGSAFLVCSILCKLLKF